MLSTQLAGFALQRAAAPALRATTWLPTAALQAQCRHRSREVSFVHRIEALRKEIRALERENEVGLKLSSQDPDLESQLFGEDTLDDFFEALHAPTPKTTADQTAELKLQLSRAKSAVQVAPTLFSPNFHRRIEASFDQSKEHEKRLSLLWSRLNDAEEKSRKLAPPPLSELAKLLEGMSMAAHIALPSESSEAEDVSKLQDPSEDRLMMPDGSITVPELASLGASAAKQGNIELVEKILLVCQEIDSLNQGQRAQSAVLEAAGRTLSWKKDSDSLLRLGDFVRQNGLTLDDKFRHALVSAFLRQGKTERALSTLQSFEESHPAPTRTYARAILHLLSSGKPHLYEEAWTTFHRMRLVAHPVPSAEIFSIMIRACADGHAPRHGGLAPQASDAERALDLFREMTVARGMRPSVEAFNATILACARSDELHHEAFRLFRQMIALQAEGSAHFAPDRMTFNALLLACARKGDLARARWIFGEMARLAASFVAETDQLGEWQLAEALARLPDEYSLAHLFRAYARYRPPHQSINSLRRSTSETASQEDSASIQDPDEGSSTQQLQPERWSDPLLEGPNSSLPQTPRAVLSEAKRIFTAFHEAMLEKLSSASSGSKIDLWTLARPSVDVINAYLRVLGTHVPKSQRLVTVSAAAFSETEECLFRPLRLQPSQETAQFVLRLSCAEPNREIADKHASEAWKYLSELEPTEEGKWRSWCWYMESLAKSRHLDKAVQELRRFTAELPPLTKQDLVSNRLTLSELQLKLSEIESGRIAVLDFQTLSILYHRLLESGNHSAHKLLLWALNAYGNQRRIVVEAILKHQNQPLAPAHQASPDMAS